MSDIVPTTNDPNLPGPALHAVSETPHLSELKDEGPFSSLISSFRDLFFPEKLPPLVLESKPIAVPDPMKTKRSPQSTAFAVVAHAVIILLIGILIARKVQLAAPTKVELTQLTAPPPPPPPIAMKQDKIGGGGGQHDMAPVTQGHLPKLAQQQIVPPKAPPTIAPKLAVEPTVVVQPNLKLADNKMPDLGMPNSNLKGFSMGNGNGSGLGSGNGNGIGPGSGGNIGGGVYHIGGSVRPPVLVTQVEPEFSEEARKAKFSGNVEVYLIVDENGNPTHVRVVRDVGMGLGEKAVEAVRQYKFKPALQNGKPVKVDMYIEVNFQIF
jgi:protein TonB